MNFEHPEHRAMLVQSLDRLLTERYAFEPREHMERARRGFDRDDWSQFAEMGVLAALFPESAGGLGGSGFDIMAVFESLGRAILVEPFLGALMAGQVLRSSTEGIHQQTLVHIMDGSYIAALAYEEAHAHHELSEVKTTAKQRDGRWILNGHKVSIPQGEQVDGFVVSARTSGLSSATTGISLFLVPAKSTGVFIKASPAIDGGRISDLDMTDVALESSALLCTVDQGYATLKDAVDRGLLGICAQAVGAMDAAKQATLDYLRTRQQFGVAIGSFQALQHRMADLLLEVEQARSAVINAAAALDAADPGAFEEAISAAKFTVGRVGTLVAEECIQMHGGMGMTWELAVSHYAKQLVMIDHQLGDQDHHLQRYITALRNRPVSEISALSNALV